MERLNLDFKGPLQSNSNNSFSLWLVNTHVFLLYFYAGTWLWLRQLLSNVLINSLLCVGRQGLFILITALLLYRRNLRCIYSNEELLQAHPVFITPLWKWSGGENCWNGLEGHSTGPEILRSSAFTQGSGPWRYPAFDSLTVVYSNKYDTPWTVFQLLTSLVFWRVSPVLVDARKKSIPTTFCPD